MASSKDYLQFILDQLTALPDITYKPMMGEFILYNQERFLAAYMTTGFW